MLTVLRNSAFFKTVGPYIAAVAVMILTALLVAVIYLTQFNLLWTAFLTGVLVAAILGMVSRSSRAEWIIARREAKISLLQEKLAREIRSRHEVELKLAASMELQQANAAIPATTAEVAVAPAAGPGVQDLYVESLSEEVAGPDDAVDRILSAIKNDEFRLYCQCITPLLTPAAQGDHYEVLIRLHEEEEDMMPPGAFFPLVEKYGLMPHLDRWVVQHVIKWLSLRPDPAPLRNSSAFFINLATASLGDRKFPEFVRDLLHQHKVPAWKLCFEITETDLSQLHDDVILFAKEIRDSGCKIAISNFGRNGVSFEPLYNVHANFLKIDGSLILDILRDPADLAQVTAIARVAKTIDVKTIAEMVESDECMAKLREIGVDHAQGFSISTPGPLESID
ncbi:MAG: EAL domain-containing protein [Georgfuchsia sp.]